MNKFSEFNFSIYYMVKNNPSRCLKYIFIITEKKLNKLEISLRIVYLNNKYIRN